VGVIIHCITLAVMIGLSEDFLRASRKEEGVADEMRDKRDTLRIAMFSKGGCCFDS